MISSGYDEWPLRQAFEDTLLDGETIQWVGQADPSVIFSKADLFLVPFSLLWGGFAIFWEAAALGLVFGGPKGGGAPLPFALFGIPFVVVGLYFIFGRFIYKARKKRRTCYAVTNKRVLISTLGKRRDVQAAFIHDIPTISKFSGSRGTGTIVFGNSNWQASMYANTGMDWMGSYYGPSAPTFHDIKDGEAVYDLVNRLRNEQLGS